jgi:hypothetical protein
MAMPAMVEVTHWVLSCLFFYYFPSLEDSDTQHSLIFLDSLESQRFLHRLCIVYVYHFFPMAVFVMTHRGQDGVLVICIWVSLLLPPSSIYLVMEMSRA